MEANEIEKKIKALPDDLKKEVIDYIDFLIMKKKKSNKPGVLTSVGKAVWLNSGSIAISDFSLHSIGVIFSSEVT